MPDYPHVFAEPAVRRAIAAEMRRQSAAEEHQDAPEQCLECGLAPVDAETGPDGKCRHTHATRIHRRPATSHVPDTPGSASARPDLDAIDERAETATGGPWGVEHVSGQLAVLHRGHYTHVAYVGVPDDPEAEADAEFIAAAREDVPALVAEVRRLTRDRDRYRTAWNSARYRAAAWRQEAADDEEDARHWREREATARGHQARAEADRRAAQQDARQTRRELLAAWGRIERASNHYADHRAFYNVDEGRMRAILDGDDEEPTPGTRDYADESAEPGDEVPTLAELADRVATLERAVRIAATTGEVRTVEDNLDDLDRRTRARLDALEPRMLAVEQTSADHS